MVALNIFDYTIGITLLFTFLPLTEKLTDFIGLMTICLTMNVLYSILL